MDHMASIIRNCQPFFLKMLVPFYTPTNNVNFNCSTSLTTLSIVGLLNFSYISSYVVVFHWHVFSFMSLKLLITAALKFLSNFNIYVFLGEVFNN